MPICVKLHLSEETLGALEHALHQLENAAVTLLNYEIKENTWNNKKTPYCSSITIFFIEGTPEKEGPGGRPGGGGVVGCHCTLNPVTRFQGLSWVTTFHPPFKNMFLILIDMTYYEDEEKCRTFELKLNLEKEKLEHWRLQLGRKKTEKS